MQNAQTRMFVYCGQPVQSFTIKQYKVNPVHLYVIYLFYNMLYNRQESPVTRSVKAIRT